MATAAQWLEGAGIDVGRAVLALVVAFTMQIGVNYANDYSDGIRGTDAERVGPLRLVGSGSATPAAVRAAALGCFALGCVAGLILAAPTSWWLVAVGALAVAAAWAYTGTSKPYGYRALGDGRTRHLYATLAVAALAVGYAMLLAIGLAAS